MNLTMWVHEEQCWISSDVCGKTIVTSQFALPIAYGNLTAESSVLNGERIVFVLHRDDASGMPVYDTKTSELKVMTIFSEFALAIAELVTKLGIEYMHLEPSGEPGGFRLLLNREAGVLLRPGLEVIAITRGFEVVRFFNQT